MKQYKATPKINMKGINSKMKKAVNKLKGVKGLYGLDIEKDTPLEVYRKHLENL